MEDVNARRWFRITARQAAECLGVSMVTLRKMEKRGELALFRTPGADRQHSLKMLEEYVQSKRRSTALATADGSN